MPLIWLRNARTGVVDISAFTAGTHYPDGYIPSGTPVALVGGLYVPYDKTEATTTGAGILAGVILTDQKVAEDIKNRLFLPSMNKAKAA